MSTTILKEADLVGPGIGNYDDVSRVLPDNYKSALSPKETQKALFLGKRFIEDGLNEALNLFSVEVPLIVDVNSGVNDYLDRDGSRTPIDFHIKNDGKHTIDAQVVQAATKWKRVALKQYQCDIGEGINTDMKAVRKDYFLDHDHSAYVDQWDWERVMTADQRNLGFMMDVVKKIWKVFKDAETYLHNEFPALRNPDIPPLPDELHFIHAEEILEMFPDLATQAARNRTASEVPRGVHYWNWCDSGRRLPARNARA